MEEGGLENKSLNALLGMAVHACSPSTGEGEAEGSACIQGQPVLHKKTLSKHPTPHPRKRMRVRLKPLTIPS